MGGSNPGASTGASDPAGGNGSHHAPLRSPTAKPEVRAEYTPEIRRGPDGGVTPVRVPKAYFSFDVVIIQSMCFLFISDHLVIHHSETCVYHIHGFSCMENTIERIHVYHVLFLYDTFINCYIFLNVTFGV